MMQYYNKGYDVYIIDNEDGTLPVIMYKNKVLKTYLKRTNSRLQYPIVNVPNHGEQYAHRLVGFCVLNVKQYYAMKKERPNETIVIDHINGNTFDYRVNNLQWLYNSDNVKKDNGYMQAVE